jgi:predicted ATPase/DNA-binding CsgD family transcriptional regulator
VEQAREGDAGGRVRGVRLSLTSFVGRRRELGELRSLLSTSRLTTITGPGGSGKTRLAEQLALRLARPLAGATAVAYLADATAPAEVVDVVADAVGLRDRTTDPDRGLVEYLRRRRLLLVMDNCEHIRDVAARVALDILAACPDVTILATSRRPLRVPGEQLFPVSGLTAEAAMALFTDRARRASPQFSVTDALKSSVVELCAQLDGMPLAIELAAARTRNLGLIDLTARLTGHLSELDSEAAVAPERQRSLRGAITWSHELLREDQRTLWRRLCAFCCGFDVGAAEDVAAFAPLDRRQVGRLLGELVDESMVVFDGDNGRYRVVEAMREFGLERLADASETDAVGARLTAWILDLVEDADRRWFGPEQAEIVDRLHVEAANIRAALEWCRSASRRDDGLRIAAAVLWYWVTRASLGEAARWFDALLDGPADPAIAAKAGWRAGYVAILQGRYADARRLLARATDLAHEVGEPGILAYLRLMTCLRAMYEQTDEDALGLARETLRDPAADAMCRSWSLIGIGLASFLRGDADECRRVSIEGVEMSRAVGEVWNQELHLRSLAYAEWQSGSPQIAEAPLLEALEIDRRLDDRWHFAWTLEALGWITVDLGQPARAARLLGMASAFWSQSGSGLGGLWRTYHADAMARLRERLGERRLAEAVAVGARQDRAAVLLFALGDRLHERETVRTDRGTRTTGRLTGRELGVAALVASGATNREIGEALFVSTRTVEKHVEHVMNKLGVGSRAEIAAWHAEAAASQPGI